MTHSNALIFARAVALLATFCGAFCFVATGTSPKPGDDARPRCLLAPAHDSIVLPRHGFQWAEDEDVATDACGDVPEEKWTRKPSGSSDLLVYADGPMGTGRYWDITVAVSDGHGSPPDRGICFRTSTTGWRTLQVYKDSPLPWLDDVDGDGKAEFILWESFPLRENASLAEYGLTAWVYRLTSEGALVIDWGLTRKLARKIAANYLAPLANSSQIAAQLRTEAAAALAKFADDRCTVAGQQCR